MQTYLGGLGNQLERVDACGCGSVVVVTVVARRVSALSVREGGGGGHGRLHGFVREACRRKMEWIWICEVR